MSTYPSTPEEYQEAWTKMNKEFVEDGLPFVINIPSKEKIEEWIKQRNR